MQDVLVIAVRLKLLSRRAADSISWQMLVIVTKGVIGCVALQVCVRAVAIYRLLESTLGHFFRTVHLCICSDDPDFRFDLGHCHVTSQHGIMGMDILG